MGLASPGDNVYVGFPLLVVLLIIPRLILDIGVVISYFASSATEKSSCKLGSRKTWHYLLYDTFVYDKHFININCPEL